MPRVWPSFTNRYFTAKNIPSWFSPVSMVSFSAISARMALGRIPRDASGEEAQMTRMYICTAGLKGNLPKK
ncbi:hypothetical protein D3C86_1868490 [compost metagenome]